MLHSNELLSLLLITASAALLTSHVLLAIGLISRVRPTVKLWLTLLPVSFWLAPYWGFRHGLRGRAVTWVISALVYAVTLLLAVRA